MKLTTFNKFAIALFMAITNTAVFADALSSQSLNPKMTIIKNNGGNILVVKAKDAVLIIDNGYTNQQQAVLPEIKKISGDLPVKYVLNTHWHGDHTGSNEAMGAKGAIIVAHDNVRSRLSAEQSIPAFNMTSQPYKAEGLPTITYPQAMHIHFNNDTLVLQHYPHGHTDSDSVVFFEQANIVHMGDHMFNTMFPFVDVDNGGNALQYVKNLESIYARLDDKTVVIPGHGPVTDKKGLADYIAMLNGTIDEVKTIKSANQTLADAKQQGLSKQWRKWNRGFIKEAYWIETIYKSL